MADSARPRPVEDWVVGPDIYQVLDRDVGHDHDHGLEQKQEHIGMDDKRDLERVVGLDKWDEENRDKRVERLLELFGLEVLQVEH